MNQSLRRLSIWLVSLLIFVVGIEAVSFVFLTIQGKSFHTPSHYYRLLTGELTRGDCTWGESVSHHPYLSTRYIHSAHCNSHRANVRGMLGEELPTEKNSDYYNVLLLGGSVAEFHFLRGHFEKQLNSLTSSPSQRPFKVWNGSITAGQQPRQAIAHLLYGDIADLVVSLEGYNELFNLRRGVSPEVPNSSWQELESVLQQNRPLAGLSTNIRKSALQLSRHPVLGLSYSSALLHTLLLQQLAPAAEQLNPIVPAINPSSFVDVYARYIFGMKNLAHGRGQKLYVFMQPVPALKKPLTPKDKAVVGDLTYGPAYQNLVANLAKHPLASSTVIPILDTFKDFRDDLYIDHIHFLGESAGDEWLAKKMVREIAKRERWKLK